MSAPHSCRVYISHGWQFGEEYDRLIALLDSAPGLRCRNRSGPERRPPHDLSTLELGTIFEIETIIERQMRGADCVLVLAGLYDRNRRWMQFEMETARGLKKPILVIADGDCALPPTVDYFADRIVSWSDGGLLAAIQALGQCAPRSSSQQRRR